MLFPASESFKNYDIMKNNSIEIFTSLKNIIDKKSIILEKNEWYAFETNEFIEEEWKNIEDNFWKNLIKNINQNQLYEKNNFKIPVKNVDLLNKIREAILLGYLQYSIKTYNNLSKLSFNSIN